MSQTAPTAGDPATTPFTPPYAVDNCDSSTQAGVRFETCPDCGGSFEVDAAGNYVTHLIAYDGQPCSTPAIAERVAAGVALLDEKRPGWDQYIDLDWLDISRGRRCVLGQLYGGDATGAGALGLKWIETVHRGFDRYRGEPNVVFDELTAEWKRVITERRLAVTR